MTYLARCPYCRGLNLAPTGPKLWHCSSCNKDFTEAVVEEPPKEPNKGGKS